MASVMLTHLNTHTAEAKDLGVPARFPSITQSKQMEPFESTVSQTIYLGLYQLLVNISIYLSVSLILDM